jgi:hypothetical protein
MLYVSTNLSVISTPFIYSLYFRSLWGAWHGLGFMGVSNNTWETQPVDGESSTLCSTKDPSYAMMRVLRQQC